MRSICAIFVVCLLAACGDEVTLGDYCAGGADCAVLDCAADASCAACPDADTDGYPAASCGGGDCDDTDPAIHPGALEACTNALDDDCDAKIDCSDPDCAAAPGCAAPPAGMNLTSCRVLFKDDATEPALPAGGSDRRLSARDDWGIAHTFRAFTYRPATNDMLLVDDYGLTSLSLDTAGTRVTDEKSVALLCSDSGPRPLVTESLTGNYCAQPFPGYRTYVNAAGTDPSALSLFPSGRAGVYGIGYPKLLLYTGAGPSLRHEATLIENVADGPLYDPPVTLPGTSTPIDASTTTVMGITFLPSAIIPGYYGHYLAYLEDSAGQHHYGILSAGSKPWENSSTYYLVNLDDLFHPVLLGPLSQYPTLEEYILTDTVMKPRPVRQPSMGGYHSMSDLIAPLSRLERFITKQGHVRLYDLSDPLHGVLVEDIPVPGWDEGAFNYRGYFAEVHDVTVMNDEVYLYVPAYSCKLLRHTIGQPGWDELDLGVTDCIRNIDGYQRVAYTLSLASDAKAVVLTDKYARTFALYDITGTQPNRLLQENLPFGYRDASMSTYGGNFWVTYYPAPLLRANGDGTYLLYLAAPLGDRVLGAGKLSALSVFTLAPGSRNSACLCQPDCTDKGCGAPDGCGGYCQSMLYGGGRGSWNSAVKGWEEQADINGICSSYTDWCEVPQLGEPPVCEPATK